MMQQAHKSLAYRWLAAFLSVFFGIWGAPVAQGYSFKTLSHPLKSATLLRHSAAIQLQMPAGHHSRPALCRLCRPASRRGRAQVPRAQRFCWEPQKSDRPWESQGRPRVQQLAAFTESGGEAV
jgi:hypothetical protein